MECEEAVAYCLSFPEVTEETPFGPEVLVYKVCGKMFATAGDAKGLPLKYSAAEAEALGSMNLKGVPERNEELRECYEAVIPGYHMNKRHWNTLVFDGTVPTQVVREMIEESYPSLKLSHGCLSVPSLRLV